MSLPSISKALLRGYEENHKTVTMAPLGFLNEDVQTVGSTKDISCQGLLYIYIQIYIPSKD